MCMLIEHVRGSRNVSKGVVGPNDNFVCRGGGGGVHGGLLLVILLYEFNKSGFSIMVLTPPPLLDPRME